MAEVYRTVGGQKIQKFIAVLPGVQGELDDKAETMASHAQATLEAHRHDGHARIVVESGRVDRYVILDDTHGLKAALSIEFGRQAGPDGKGAMEGLAILRGAAGKAAE